MQVDYSDLKQGALEARTRAAQFEKQWMTWLTLASAGGLALMLSFSTGMAHPNHTLLVLLPAYFAFLLGMATAGLSFATKSREEMAQSSHSASAFNREEYRTAAGALPTVIASPPRLADEANRNKDAIVAKCNAAHDLAEEAWKARVRWLWLTRILLANSVCAFIFGVAWPGLFVFFGGDLVGGR